MDKELDMACWIEHCNQMKAAKKRNCGKNADTRDIDETMKWGCVEIMKGKF